LTLPDYVQLAGALLAVIALRELGTWPQWTAEVMSLLAATVVGAAVVLAVWAWRRRRTLPEAPALRVADPPERFRARRNVGAAAAYSRGRHVRLSLFPAEREMVSRGQAGPPTRACVGGLKVRKPASGKDIDSRRRGTWHAGPTD
jgi:hypothetical protein